MAFLPMVGICAAGAAWSRLGRRPSLASLAPLASDVAVPCLVLTTLARTSVRIDSIELLVAAACACTVLSAVMSASLLLPCKLNLRVYLGPLTFPNTGSVGLPLSSSLFGPVGLTYASAVYVVSSLLNGVFGQALAAGKVNLRAVLTLPLFHAAWLGVAAAALRAQGPAPLLDIVLAATGLAGQVALPLMLLMLGASLGKLAIGTLRRTAALGMARLLIGAAAGMAVCWLFRMEGMEGSVFALQAAMPVGVNSYLYAQRWDAQPVEVAGLVLCSTLETCCLVPVILVWWG